MSLFLYLVHIEGPRGLGALEVPTSQGPEAAARRAFYSAASLGWGDLDELEIVGVTLLGNARRLRDDEPAPADLFSVEPSRRTP